MSALIPNNIAANPEVSRGVQRLYADLKKNIADNDGKLEAGFSESFTSRDGLIKITLSSQGLAAYAGDRNADGSSVTAKDVGISLVSDVRSGYSGENDVTAESTALSDAIHDAKQVSAHEADMMENFAITTFSVDPNKDETLPQPGIDDGATAVAATPASKAGATVANPLQNVALQAKQEATNHLIDTLTTFLQGLKSDKATPLGSAPADNSKADNGKNAPDNKAASLFIRIDIKA